MKGLYAWLAKLNGSPISDRAGVDDRPYRADRSKLRFFILREEYL